MQNAWGCLRSNLQMRILCWRVENLTCSQCLRNLCLLITAHLRDQFIHTSFGIGPWWKHAE